MIIDGMDCDATIKDLQVVCDDHSLEQSFGTRRPECRGNTFDATRRQEGRIELVHRAGCGDYLPNWLRQLDRSRERICTGTSPA